MMRFRRLQLLAPLMLFLAGSIVPAAGIAAPELPSKLSDQDFWRLSESISEPDGKFQSDNLLSNEMVFARVVPSLVAATKPGGVYLGVGPEQNFTYIAAMRPRMVFITDVRRGNLQLQLMYKALFELSADRADFVSRLFTKKRPDGLTSATSAHDLMSAYWDVWSGDEAAYASNLQAIDDELTKKHHLPLTADDLQGIARVYRAFYWYGPGMNYSASTTLRPVGNGRGMSYADLVSQTDAGGHGLSYLVSEESFRVLKDLESKNMIVPVVGNFSGPKALRGVGAYIREHGATVSAFYVSNVEQYLRRDTTWPAFCANVATMPLDDTSVFIRPSGSLNAVLRPVAVPGGAGGNLSFVATLPPGGPGTSRSGLVPMANEVRNCGAGVARQ
jgi:hypothetical protein